MLTKARCAEFEQPTMTDPSFVVIADDEEEG
jgi:hypothetical protein